MFSPGPTEQVVIAVNLNIVSQTISTKIISGYWFWRHWPIVTVTVIKRQPPKGIGPSPTKNFSAAARRTNRVATTGRFTLFPQPVTIRTLNNSVATNRRLTARAARIFTAGITIVTSLSAFYNTVATDRRRGLRFDIRKKTNADDQQGDKN